MDEKNAVAILKRKRESDKAGMVRYRERRISQGDKQVTTWWSAENVLWLREWQKQHGGTAETIINMAIQNCCKKARYFAQFAEKRRRGRREY